MSPWPLTTPPHSYKKDSSIWTLLVRLIIPYLTFCILPHLGGENGMEWKRIILKYSSILLFESFNRGNGKPIPLFWSLRGRECDVWYNLLFNYCNLLFLIFLCKKCYFRFRWFISLFLGAFNVFLVKFDYWYG